MSSKKRQLMNVSSASHRLRLTFQSAAKKQALKGVHLQPTVAEQSGTCAPFFARFLTRTRRSRKHSRHRVICRARERGRNYRVTRIRLKLFYDFSVKAFSCLREIFFIFFVAFVVVDRQRGGELDENKV